IALALAREDPILDPRAFLSRLDALIAPALQAKLSEVERFLAVEAPAQEAVGTLGNGVWAEESVPLALFAFLRWGPDFETVVTATASGGGDIDSIAAMSGTLAGAWGGEGALPALWMANLENQRHGRDDVAELASRLFEQWRNKTDR